MRNDRAILPVSYFFIYIACLLPLFESVIFDLFRNRLKEDLLQESFRLWLKTLYIKPKQMDGRHLASWKKTLSYDWLSFCMVENEQSNQKYHKMKFKKY